MNNDARRDADLAKRPPTDKDVRQAQRVLARVVEQCGSGFGYCPYPSAQCYSLGKCLLRLRDER